MEQQATGAQRSYEANRAEIKNLLLELKKELKRHKKLFGKNTEHWGYPNELGVVVESLNQNVKFLGRK